MESFAFLVIALTLLAMGSGVIKPNISTLMGLTYDQQRPGMTQLRSDAFAIFYFSINIGAAISQFAMPPIRSNYGYAVAFLFPAALMVVAFLIFAAGKKHYAQEKVGHVESDPKERSQRWVVLGRIFGLFFLVMFFWAIFDQSSSTWIFFANACMNLHMLGRKVDPDQIQAFNPVFILLLLPLITLMFRRLSDRGMRVRPTDKMIVGFLLTAVCMGVMAFAAWLAGSATLRPYFVKGDASVIVAGQTISGDLALAQADIETITLDKKQRDGKPLTLTKPDGTSAAVESTIKLTGDYLRIVPRDKGFIIEGAKKAAYEAEDEATKKPHDVTIAEGDLSAALQPTSAGPLDSQDRWFVAPQDQVSVWWQVFAYLIITVAEVLISVTGLELAYTAAPKSMTGFVTACWLLTVGLANFFINAPVTRLYTSMQPVTYFAMLAGTLLFVGVAFVFVARRFNQPLAEVKETAAA